jgi:hypothetical protein
VVLVLNLIFICCDLMVVQCQSMCASHGFSAAATTGRSCHCANQYPLLYYQVEYMYVGVHPSLASD